MSRRTRVGACLVAGLLLLTNEQSKAHSQEQSAPRNEKPRLRPLADYEAENLHDLRVFWNPDFKAADPFLRLRVRAALLYDTETISRLVPEQSWRRLRNARIAVSPTSDLASDLPSKGHGLGFHVAAQWLTANGLDVERQGVIEIYNASDYLTVRAAQPLVVLHEMTHMLFLGARPEIRSSIIAAYKAAVDGGKYNEGRHVLPHRPDGSAWGKAYAISNVNEYAAELSEAFWGRNDWFPFVREELIQFDKHGCDAVARLWGTACKGW